MESPHQLQQNHGLLQHAQTPSEEDSISVVNTKPTSSSPASAKPPWATARFWRTASGDIILAIGAISFLILGLVAISQNGKTVDEVSWLPNIVTAASYGPTLFPILFSAALGRFLTGLAYFRLERGTSVQTMEQLYGSQTVVSSLMTQYNLRTWNQNFIFMAGLLTLVWSLSPLGSQASLRVASLGQTNRSSIYNMSYIDITKTTFSPYDSDYSNSLANFLLGTSLILPMDLRSEAQDSFGNLRVPLIEQLQDVPSLEWIKIDGTVEHASIIGLPFSLNSTNATDLSFSVDTSYMWLNCSTENTRQPVNITDISKFTSMTSGPFGIAWSAINSVRGANVPRTVYVECPGPGFGGKSESVFMSVCNLTTTFVTVNATCQQPSASQRSCGATAIRHILLNATNSSRSLLDTAGATRDSLFVDHLIKATFINETNPGMTPATFGYLADPSNPFGFYTQYPDWRNVTAQDFSIRLSQLLNTYWLASTAKQPVRGDMSAAFVYDLNGNPILKVLNTTALGSVSVTTLYCSVGWSTMLLIAALVVLAAAVANLVLGAKRRGPDILSQFSALLKDNTYANMQSEKKVTSLSDGWELARAWRSVQVQIGDVAADTANEGYIAIGTPETVNISPLGTRKIYL